MIATRTSLAGAALAALLAAPAAAQVPLTPRALGTGGAYVAVARGHESLFLNPANLALPGTTRWSIALPQAAAGVTLTGPRFGDLRDFANVDDIPESRKDELLDAVPTTGAEVAVDVRLPVAAVQVGGLAFGVAYGVLGSHSADRDLVDLYLFGFDETRFLNSDPADDYTIRHTGGKRASYLDFAAGYGRSVGPLSVGATAHYYRGRSLVRSEASNPRFLFAERDVEVKYTGVIAPGGSGWGVDVGAALQPAPGVTLSAAVANAFSSMDWSDDLRYRQAVFTRDDFAAEDPLRLRNEYERSDRPLGADAPAEARALAEGLDDEAGFPAALRLGAAWAPGTGTAVSAAYHTHLTEGRLAGEWETLLGVGVQQKLPLVTARAGFSTNLDGGTLLGGGISLGPLELGVARLEEGAGSARSGWIGTFGLSARAK